MFGWFRKKIVPPPASASDRPRGPGVNVANPGLLARGRIEFANEERQWSEAFDCTTLLRDAMSEAGRSTSAEGDEVVDVVTGLRCRPLLAEFTPIDAGGVKTVTTVEVAHPIFGDAPTFEFQHSQGADTAAAIREGFALWLKTDLATLAGATRDAPADCMAMSIDLPAADGRPARRRRVIFGPVAHFESSPHAAAAAADDGHAFCPCCLFTRSMDAFRSLIESDRTFGLRLFAMRGDDGVAGADCRVNGDDSPRGQAALLAYVATWPASGLEFRKQYVIVQDAPPASP